MKRYRPKLIKFNPKFEKSKDQKLAKAVLKGNLKAAEKLLEKGANPNAESQRFLIDIYTPFSIACKKAQNFEMVKLLYNYRANINPDIQDNPDITIPLSEACSKITPDHYKIVEFLLKYGADVNCSNDLFNTPLNSICSYSGYNMGNNDQQVKMSVETFKLLLDKGANISANIENKNYLLHEAAQNLNAGIAELLIINGADVNLVADYTYKEKTKHETPLISLINGVEYFNIKNETEKDESMKIAKLLIDNGADKHYKNQDGKTAYDIAVEKNLNCFFDILK